MKILLLAAIAAAIAVIVGCDSIDSVSGGCYIGQDIKLTMVTDSEGNNFKPKKLERENVRSQAMCGIDSEAVPFNWERRLDEYPAFYFRIPPDGIEDTRGNLLDEDREMLKRIYAAGTTTGQFRNYQDLPLWPLASSQTTGAGRSSWR